MASRPCAACTPCCGRTSPWPDDYFWYDAWAGNGAHSSQTLGLQIFFMVSTSSLLLTNSWHLFILLNLKEMRQTLHMKYTASEWCIGGGKSLTVLLIGLNPPHPSHIFTVHDVLDLTLLWTSCHNIFKRFLVLVYFFLLYFHCISHCGWSKFVYFTFLCQNYNTHDLFPAFC